MKKRMLIALLAWAAGILILYLLMHQKPITTHAAEPFSQEQIEMFESMVTIVTPEKVAEALQPTYVGLDDIPLTADLQYWAQDKCRQYHIAYSFFLAICESESQFGSFNVGEEGYSVGDGGLSKGIMQIRKCNWNRYPELDVDNDYDNLEIGIRMLGELMDKYHEADMVIMAYKGGENAMLEWVEEGFRLPACDTLEDRMIFWEAQLNAIRH